MKKLIWGYIPYLYYRVFNAKSEKIKYFKYMKDKGYTHYPYEYAEKYLNLDIEVMTDPIKKLSYVNHTGNKKLYFPKVYTTEKIVRVYKSLLIEQDIESPHHYVDSVSEFKDKILLDIGSAEGLTSLDAIEEVRFIYLFECDEKWIEALNATFEPWKDKIQIIRKYISNTNSGDYQTLDNFLKDKSGENIFLKMDIEGEERKALEGAEELFSNAENLDFAVCIYHKKDDKKVISGFFDKFRCNYSQRKGFLYYKHRLRPCLIRGSKKKS